MNKTKLEVYRGVLRDVFQNFEGNRKLHQTANRGNM